MRRFVFALLLLSRAGVAQEGGIETVPALPPASPHEAKLPDGRSRSEAILKQDYARSLSDAAALTALAQSLQANLEKEGRDVLSLQTLKKLDEIEKLTKRIRSRMRRY